MKNYVQNQSPVPHDINNIMSFMRWVHIRNIIKEFWVIIRWNICVHCNIKRITL